MVPQRHLKISLRLIHCKIIRSAWGLFALGNISGKNGNINFTNLTCEKEIADRLKINLDTCLSVALKHLT